MMRCVFLFVCVFLLPTSVSSHRYDSQRYFQTLGGRDAFQFNKFTPRHASDCPVRIERAVCRMQKNPNLNGVFTVSGEIRMSQSSDCRNTGPVQFTLDLQGFPADGRITMHGIHVHNETNFSDGCNSFGPHFNPFGNIHGSPSPRHALERRHVGDLGNVRKNTNGRIFEKFTAPKGVTLNGSYSIVSRGLVIHEHPDDLGQGGNEESLKTGNSGVGLACCAIERE